MAGKVRQRPFPSRVGSASIKGAIPLELCHAVSPSNDKLGFSVEIADRTFTCRWDAYPSGDAHPSDASDPRWTTYGECSRVLSLDGVA